jgi:anti-anti-sigma factor
MTQLTISITSDQDVVWIRVGGEVDLAKHDQLSSTLDSVDLVGARTVHVDLRRLEFCDSQGCQVLLDFQQRARSAGADIELSGITRIVAKVMRFITPEPSSGI